MNELEKKLKKYKKLKNFFDILGILMLFILPLLRVQEAYGGILIFAVLTIVLIIAVYYNKARIKQIKKEMQNNSFLILENEIEKNYTKLNIPVGEFENLEKELKNIAYDKYYIEDDCYESYEIIERRYIGNKRLNIKDVSAFRRKDHNIVLMTFEEEEKDFADMDKNAKITIVNYVFIANMNKNLRMHINVDESRMSDTNFDEMYYDNEELIKENETGNYYYKVTSKEKEILVDLYNKFKLNNSIVMKDEKLYIRIETLNDYTDILNVLELFMKEFELFIK